MFEQITVGTYLVQYLSGTPGLTIVPVQQIAPHTIRFCVNTMWMIIPPHPVRELLPLEKHRAEIERLVRVEIALQKSLMPKANG